MKKIDYRLDLFNAIKSYEENKTEHDNNLIIMYNDKDGDLAFSLNGMSEVFCAIMTNENEFINFENDRQREGHKGIKKIVLNMSLNLIRTDTNVRKVFEDYLKSTQPISTNIQITTI
jgi:hypothetical protein